MDDDNDEDLRIEKDQCISCDVPALALEDLLSPRPTDQVFSPIPMDCRESAETLFVSNLLPQFQDIAVDKFERETGGDVFDDNDISMISGHHQVMDLDDQKDVSQDFYSQNTSEIDLQRAIQSAIERRKAVEPQFVMNQSYRMITDRLESNAPSIPIGDKITSIPMGEITKAHRFIHFHVNTQQMDVVDVDVIEQRCSELLDVFVSKLNASNVFHGKIECQTSRYNAETSQCTLYLSTSSNVNEACKWSLQFLDVFDSFQMIPLNRNSITFDQLTPL